jgi:putative transposase
MLSLVYFFNLFLLYLITPGSAVSQAFINFFDGRTQYPTFKKRQGKQSIQYPQNVKILSASEIKFLGHLGAIKVKIHRDTIGKLRTVTVSKMPDGRATMLHY